MFFVTGNNAKFAEAVKLIPGLKQAKLDVPEIQSDSLEEVARFSIEYAFKELGEACFVEDAGLFIDALKGFPGLYSRYILDTIGNVGVLKLMEGAKNRKAHFETCVAYHDGKEIHVFRGRVDGTIAEAVRGNQVGNFGFDPVFIPEGREKTFAEDFEYKQSVSHRRIGLEKFLEFLQKGKDLYLSED